jgi:segregation and condensation protein B
MSETPEPMDLAPIDPVPSPAEESPADAADGMTRPDAEAAPGPDAAAAEEISAGAPDAVEVMQEEDPEAAAAADEEAEPYTDEQTAELRNVVESLIFASDEPIAAKFIRQMIDDVNRDRVEANRIRATTEGIKRAVAAINRTYADRAFHIIPIAGGFAFATKPKYSVFVGKLAKEKARRKLSATAIESLAIIAYKQPITKSEIEFIRGVNADYIIKTLLEKNLITITGRASTPGRPLLYGTTDEFLKHFGLNEITDLPKPREIEELIGETELEVEKRMLAEQQELEFKDELAQKMDGGQKQKSSGSRPPLRQHTGKAPEAPITAPQADAAPPVEAPIVQETPVEPQAAETVLTEGPQIETEAISESSASDHPSAADEQAGEPTTAEETIAGEHVSEVLLPEEEAEAIAAGGTAELIDEPASAVEEMQLSEVIDEPVIEEETIEVQAVEEPAHVEVPAIEEPAIIEEPQIEEPLYVEEPHTEESAFIEELQTEEPAVIDVPAAEELAVEPVETETPIAEEPILIEPVVEQPEVEEPAVEQTVIAEEAEMPAIADAPEEITELIDTPSVELNADADASTEDAPEQHEAAEADGEAHAPEKGWSKWKTKIKTFFKKLFV